jgi:hypothetical protein
MRLWLFEYYAHSVHSGNEKSRSPSFQNPKIHSSRFVRIRGIRGKKPLLALRNVQTRNENSLPLFHVEHLSNPSIQRLPPNSILALSAFVSLLRCFRPRAV